MNDTEHRVTIISHFSDASRGRRRSTGDLAEFIARTGVLQPLTGGLGPAGRWAAAPVADAVAEALRLNLDDIIVWGWQTHQALRAAARATLPGTGPAQHVGLATHQITSEHHPQVDVIVDAQPPMTITFDLTMVFKLDAMLLTIQRGRLVGMSPAGCQVTMTFGARGINVTRSKGYALPELIDLRSGLRLLPASAYEPAPAIVSQRARSD